MSDSLELRDDDFECDVEAPEGYRSEQDKSQFLLWFVLAAIAVFLTQVMLPQLVMIFVMPQFSILAGMNVKVPQANRAFRWQGELWVPVQRIEFGRQPGSVLRVLNPDGTWVESRDIVLTATADHYLADGDQLWLVSSGTVGLWKNGQLTTLYPKRGLIQPASPFLHDDHLSVFDRQADGHVDWLEYEAGEWVKRAALYSPVPAQPSSTATITK